MFDIIVQKLAFYVEEGAGRLNSLRTIALREAAAYALTSCKGAIVLY